MVTKLDKLLKRAGVDGMEPVPSAKELRRIVAAGGRQRIVHVPKREIPAIECDIYFTGKEIVH